MLTLGGGQPVKMIHTALVGAELANPTASPVLKSLTATGARGELITHPSAPACALLSRVDALHKRAPVRASADLLFDLLPRRRPVAKEIVI